MGTAQLEWPFGTEAPKWPSCRVAAAAAGGNGEQEQQRRTGSRQGVCERVWLARWGACARLKRHWWCTQIGPNCHTAGQQLAGPAVRLGFRGRAWRGWGGRAVALAGGGASSHGRGCLADLPADSTSSTYIWPMVRRGHVGIENSAAPAQTARGNTGTGCRRVDGSELAPSFAPFEHIYTANARELPNRTWV